MSVRKLIMVLVALALLSSLCLERSWAIRRRAGGGWGATTQYGLLFNPDTVETIRAEVLEVTRFTPFRRMAYGLKVIVKTDQEVISVHIGPGWYVERLGVSIEPRDQIAVKGSRIVFDGAPAIIAAEVKKGDQTILLRTDEGVPAWHSD